MYPSNYSKLYNIVINGRGYFARYYNKGTAKKNRSQGCWQGNGTTAGWHIQVPTGMWWFDDTIGGMKKEVKSKYPTATFHKRK